MVSAPKPIPEADVSWVDVMRAGDFREAARRIDLLPADHRGSPEVRYARARAAMGVGDYARAYTELDGLERALPILAFEVKRDRAECALEIGPYGDASAYFGAKLDAESAVKAGLAHRRAGELALARAQLDRALRLLGPASDAHATTVRVQARALRAEVVRALGDHRSAATDLRWLAIEAPATESGRSAERELASLTPPARLTAEQELARARKLAEAGLLDDALRSIDSATQCTGQKPTESAVVRARGLACYLSRADYLQAAKLLEQSAKLDPREAAHDAFLAARALSRAQDDATAIDRYEALIHKYPTSPFAEEARYLAARLRFLLGRWDAAIVGYKKYLASFPKKHPGKFARASRYELALALLASKHPTEAGSILDDLAKEEDDSLDRASLEELSAVALIGAGQRERARDRLSKIIRERPLSFAALAAASRFVELGEAPPPLVSPPLAALPIAPALSLELPEKAELFRRLGLVLDAERELAQHETELLTRYAPRGYEALCEAYGVIGAGAARFRIGRSAVKGDALDYAPTPATRWAWECVYPTPFSELVRAAEASRGLPSGLLHAVMRQESAFRPDAVSPANAIGLLQLVPNTASRVAAELGMQALPELLRLPSYNVELGSFYLKKMLATFGGQVALAAAAYNAGPRAVSRWLETGEDLPLDVWVARIPFGETRGYVARVVGNLARYDYLQGGDGAVLPLTLALPKGVRAGAEDY
jgi:soluble lytic murein transglycosylase